MVVLRPVLLPIWRNLIILGVSVVIVLGNNHGDSEFDSSQQSKLSSSSSSSSSSSGGGPVVRNVDISGSTSFGNRYVGGGKYRSSYYYPKTLVITTTTPAPPPPTPVQGQSSSSSQQSSSGPSPVWVVWGRQGTPFEGGYNSPASSSSSDYYQYQVDGNNDKYYPNDNDKYYLNDKYYSHKDKYYGSSKGDKYYYSGNNYLSEEEDPYDAEPSSNYLKSKSKRSKNQNWVRSVDSEEEEEEDQDNRMDESWARPKVSKLNLDGLSLAQLKGLMKTRRTGGSEILGGILSIKGLKLGAIGLFYLFRGVMILLWKFLPWIFLAMILLLFVPVPILTIPAAAGRLGGIDGLKFNVTDLTHSAYSLLERVAQSEECVERISCEIRRQSRDTWLHPILKMLIFQYESELPQSIQRMAKAYIQHRKCKMYTCFVFNDKNNVGKKFKQKMTEKIL